MKTGRILLGLVFLATVPGICSQATAASPAKSVASDDFSDPAYGFAFTPPPDWVKLASADNGHIRAEYCPREKQPDGTRAQLIVSVFGVLPGTTNADIPARLKADPKKLFSDVEWSDVTATNLGGEPAIEMVQTATTVKSGHRYKRQWVAVIHDGKEYTFLLAAAPDQYEQLLPIATTVREGFKWIPVVAAAPTTRPVDTIVAYEDPGKRFKFSLPSRWKRQTSKAPVAVMFVAPVDDPTNNLVRTVNVVLQHSPGAVDINVAMDAVEKSLAQKMKQFKLISTKDLSIAGIDAKQIDYTIDEGGQAMHITQVYVSNMEHVVVLSLGTAASSYETDRSDFDAIISSFQIPNP